MSKLSSIIKRIGIQCVLMLVLLTLSTSAVSADPPDPNSGDEGVQPAAPACSSDPAKKFKPSWMIYGNDPTRMHILIETDTGVDNDSNHMKIEFTQSGVHCSRDYHTMDIKDMDDRRLWTFSCSGFEPNKVYNYTIYYREHHSSIIDYCWHTDSGNWFLSPPADSSFSKLYFYGYGDTRTYAQFPNDDTPINKVAKQMYEHHNNHGNAGAFVLHTGDIVPNGGKVAHLEVKDGHKYEYQKVDPWSDQFFNAGQVGHMLAQLPIFTTIGNHDFTGDDGDNPQYYYRYFQYPMYDAQGSGNHGNYRIGWDVHKDTGQASSWTDPHEIPGWYGGHNNGGGIAVGKINLNDIPDLIAFHVDNPEDPDHDYYRIGWDVDPSTGQADSWTDPIPGGEIADSRLGGGVAVTDINDNGVADLVVSYVFNYSNGATRVHYRIGWDLSLIHI